MSGEKLNDFNDVHAPRRAYLSAHHPSIIAGCWCGATTGPLRWGDRLWCGDCIPEAGKAEAVSELRGGGAAYLTLADLHRSLTRIEAWMLQVLEAVGPRKDPAAPSAPMPLQPGDRASYNGRRGVLRSIGVAGTGILYDDGRYALLTNAMAAKLVRE